MKRPSNFFLILILGALATVSPFAIDLYLPAFSQMASELNTTTATIALSLSSYFIGLSVGQLAYGPVLDRFGRKLPLYFGLTVFILASLGCLMADSVEALIAFRFLQALGGCAAQVGAVAMVRDFFPPRESAKIFSLLMLIIAVSPMLAPTVGGIVTVALGWHWVFVLLAGFALVLILVAFFFLPEGHQADPSIALKPGPISRTYLAILKEPQFYTYALSGAFAFSGLFVYVAGSPILFMDIFQLNAQTYGGIFAFLSVGLIGTAQVNILLTRRFTSEQIFRAALGFQAAVGLLFLAGTLLGGLGLIPTVAFLFLILSSVGLSNPNASALALAPFSKNAGSASALLGFLQIGTGAVASAGVGMIGSKSALPIIAILSLTSLIGLGIFFTGRRRILTQIEGEEAAVMAH